MTFSGRSPVTANRTEIVPQAPSRASPTTVVNPATTLARVPPTTPEAATSASMLDASSTRPAVDAENATTWRRKTSLNAVPKA